MGAIVRARARSGVMVRISIQVLTSPDSPPCRTRASRFVQGRPSGIQGVQICDPGHARDQPRRHCPAKSCSRPCPGMCACMCASGR